MRHYILLILVFYTGILCLTSCEDLLDLKPENSVTFKNAYETENDMESAVRLCAQKLREIPVLDNVWMGHFADSIGSSSTVAWRNLDPSEVRYGAWNQWYSLIGAANVVISYADQIKASEDRIHYYQGQGHFYRAFAYWCLLRDFGDCVVIGDDANFEPAFPKSSWTEVAEYAIRDARKAVQMLPEYTEMKDANGNSPLYKNVPCKGAANALLAHLCACKAGWKWFAQPAQQNYDEMELWKEAEAACTSIIGSETGVAAGIYRLVATPEEISTKVFKGNSVESIFELQYAPFWDEMRKNFTTNADTWALCYCNWRMQTYCYGRGLDCIKSCNTIIKAETAKKMFPQGDLRRETYFWKLDSMSHDTLLNVTGGYAYPNMFRDIIVKTSSSVSGQFDHFDYNAIVWRLADIHLLRAECRARLGKKDEAISDLNQVRGRARAKLYDASEYAGSEYTDKLRYAIFKEREKELLFEGQRYFDVLRNGEEYVRGELSEAFRRIPLQDLIDGCAFVAISPVAFGRNTLLRQNAWWNRYL